MEYYTLIGGGIDAGEDGETALHRELREETGMQVANPRLVFVEDAGDLYGEQYVYLCEYQGGDPQLASDSEEAMISALGKNTYTPMWLPLSELNAVPFCSASVRAAVLQAFEQGFPDTPQRLAFQA